MEEILIPLFVFSFVYLTIKLILDHKKHRLAAGEGRSLGTSELKAMIREAVTEATAPLVERIDALEDRALEEHREPLLSLEAPEESPVTESRKRAVQRRIP